MGLGGAFGVGVPFRGGARPDRFEDDDTGVKFSANLAFRGEHGGEERDGPPAHRNAVPRGPPPGHGGIPPGQAKKMGREGDDDGGDREGLGRDRPAFEAPQAGEEPHLRTEQLEGPGRSPGAEFGVGRRGLSAGVGGGRDLALNRGVRLGLEPRGEGGRVTGETPANGAPRRAEGSAATLDAPAARPAGPTSLALIHPTGANQNRSAEVGRGPALERSPEPGRGDPGESLQGTRRTAGENRPTAPPPNLARTGDRAPSAEPATAGRSAHEAARAARDVAGFAAKPVDSAQAGGARTAGMTADREPGCAEQIGGLMNLRDQQAASRQAPRPEQILPEAQRLALANTWNPASQPARGTTTDVATPQPRTASPAEVVGTEPTRRVDPQAPDVLGPDARAEVRSPDGTTTGAPRTGPEHRARDLSPAAVRNPDPVAATGGGVSAAPSVQDRRPDAPAAAASQKLQPGAASAPHEPKLQPASVVNHALTTASAGLIAGGPAPGAAFGAVERERPPGLNAVDVGSPPPVFFPPRAPRRRRPGIERHEARAGLFALFRFFRRRRPFSPNETEADVHVSDADDEGARSEEAWSEGVWNGGPARADLLRTDDAAWIDRERDRVFRPGVTDGLEGRSPSQCLKGLAKP